MASATAGGRWWRGLARIRYRLLLVNLIVVGVPLAGVAFARQHERQLLVALEDDLVHQGELVRALVGADLDRAAELRAAAQNTRTRIRLVDRHGAVVADSHAGGPPEGAEPPVPSLAGRSPTHAAGIPGPVPVAERREIRAALAGRYGAATRLWERQERVYLFVALPIRRAGEVVGAVYLTRSTQGVKRQLYALRGDLFRLLAAALVATTVLSFFLAATIARPLARLTRQAERVAAGERPTGLALARHDEIGQLARAVERMAGELDRRAAEVHALAADVSHGLKTPLAGIRGAAELLRDGACEDPAARERFLAIIEDDAARLDRLIGKLLELSRSESDDGPVVEVDLAALAREVAAADPHGVPVRVSGEGVARARREPLATALANLVANAAQHAVGEVSVRVAGGRVEVQNFGPVVPAQARVWDRFYTTRGGQGGSGLGLSIVRAVIERQGGRVGYTSEAEAGTTFWFELPTSGRPATTSS